MCQMLIELGMQKVRHHTEAEMLKYDVGTNVL